jgi:hypothetical protein
MHSEVGQNEDPPDEVVLLPVGWVPSVLRPPRAWVRVALSRPWSVSLRRFSLAIFFMAFSSGDGRSVDAH